MASILPGFEYDIFISYRHNDNLDGWVSDFVQNLEKELKGTLKDQLTIYFDKSPGDGLLETHHVDKSLEGKLKCLIFIPIISQTYCDPKSFAWQHEFCSFNKLSKADSFGREVRLANGNVASRILPIKIHDLDAEDKQLLDTEFGGVLRAMDFIFKSAGVNRPLRAAEEHAQDNQNKIFYRDQINKVANAIKDLIAAFRNFQRSQGEKVSDEPQKSAPRQPGRKRKGALVVAVVIAASLGLYYFTNLNKSQTAVSENDRSVAVLAFSDMSPGKDQEWFSDGLTEEILNSLANLRELKVTARTSSFYFKGKDVPFEEIAQKLGVAHIVEGSVRRNDKQLRITAQLIRTRDGFHIWSQTYDRTTDDVFKVQTDIAENIAKALLMTLTPDSQSKLATTQSANVEAYEYYLKGYKIHSDKYGTNYQMSDFEESERSLLKSISLDPGYGEAYGALADLYDTRSNVRADRVKYRRLRDSTMRIGFRLNPNSVQVLNVMGWSFLKRDEPNFDSAFYHFRRAYEVGPNDHLALFGLGNFYGRIGLYERAVKFMKRGLQLDPLSIRDINGLGFEFIEMGLYEEARNQFLKALELDAGNLQSHNYLGIVAVLMRDREGVSKELATIERLDPTYRTNYLKSVLLAMEGKREEALRRSFNLDVYSILGMKSEFLLKLDSISKSNVRPPDPGVLSSDPFYEFVRSDPRFKVLLEKLKRQNAENLAKYPTPG